MRICHIINDLHVGGAEMMLLKLLTRLDGRSHPATVISLVECGPVGCQIRDLGIDVKKVGIRRKRLPSALRCLAQYLVNAQPDVIQTWQYHSDLLGGAMGKLALGNIPVVWNIRHSSLDEDKCTTRLTAKLSAKLSRRIPSRIIVNSQAGWDSHAAIGYDDRRMTLIGNGFDTDKFKPSYSARSRIRRELGLSDETPLVGVIGRYHRHKDHSTLVQAAAAVGDRVPGLQLLLCGERLDRENLELCDQITKSGLSQRFHLLGPRTDIPALQAAIDLAVSSSRSEGFPNVIGEAMACGVPCVATDVGDTARLVGDTGTIVAPGEPHLLAEAIVHFFARPQTERIAAGKLARRRILDHFGIDRIAAQYASLWDDVAASRRCAPSPSHTAPTFGSARRVA